MQTNNQLVEVLGAYLNISAYVDDNSIADQTINKLRPLGWLEKYFEPIPSQELVLNKQLTPSPNW